MMTEKNCAAVLLLASVTLTVKSDTPEPVGVPVIAPVDEFRLSPAGSDPERMLHVYGVAPPAGGQRRRVRLPGDPVREARGGDGRGGGSGAEGICDAIARPVRT